jgi:hypothetical protein
MTDNFNSQADSLLGIIFFGGMVFGGYDTTGKTIPIILRRNNPRPKISIVSSSQLVTRGSGTAKKI